MNRIAAIFCPVLVLAALVSATNLLTPESLALAWRVVSDSSLFAILLAVTVTVKVCSTLTCLCMWAMSQWELRTQRRDRRSIERRSALPSGRGASPAGLSNSNAA